MDRRKDQSFNPEEELELSGMRLYGEYSRVEYNRTPELEDAVTYISIRVQRSLERHHSRRIKLPQL